MNDMERLAYERVKTGAAFLDEKMPGWADKVDLNILELADCQKCVLGQLGGEFFQSAAKLFGQPDDGSPVLDVLIDGYGFDSPDRLSDDVAGTYYRYLDAAWTDEILSRRSDALAVNDKHNTVTK